MKIFFGVNENQLKTDEGISSLTELQTFFLIDSLSDHYLFIEEEETLKEIKQLTYKLILHSSNFGTEVTENLENVCSPIFLEWFSFYKSHFDFKLTDEEYHLFVSKFDNNEDYTDLLPKRSWKNNRKKDLRK